MPPIMEIPTRIVLKPKSCKRRFCQRYQASSAQPYFHTASAL